ncbi:MAG: glycosyltransferase 2 family protein [Treponematales bacterium]
MNKSKVSVIVPVYNAAAFLERCLTTLVNQTLSDIQIIMVNDGSTDNSEEIIRHYQSTCGDRILYVKQENSGTGAARNTGIGHAQGEFIGFVDADDYIEPDMYEKMYAMAKDKSADLVECAYYKEWDSEPKKTTIKKPKHSTRGIFHTEDYVLHTESSVCNKIIRREIIENHALRFPAGLNYEDSEFVCKTIPFVRTFTLIETPLYHYLQYRQSRYHAYNEKVRDSFVIYNNILDFYRRNNVYEKYKTQLEYIYIRTRLGASFFRICRIKAPVLREGILEENWRDLLEHFPGWRKNRYLWKDCSPLGMYFKTVNHMTYQAYAKLFAAIFK